MHFIKLFSIGTIFCVSMSGMAFGQSQCVNYARTGLQKVHTPKVNSLERKAILDALRADMLANLNVDVIFVVKYFKADLTWAFIQAEPKARTTDDTYEPVSALLQRTEGCWKVAGYVSSDDPDETYENALNRLRADFPGATAKIFP